MKQLTDLHELIGKTIQAVINQTDEILLLTTDNDLLIVKIESGYYGDHYLGVVSDKINAANYRHAFVQLGLLSTEQAREQERADQAERQRIQQEFEHQQYLRLKARFEP